MHQWNPHKKTALHTTPQHLNLPVVLQLLKDLQLPALVAWCYLPKCCNIGRIQCLCAHIIRTHTPGLHKNTPAAGNTVCQPDNIALCTVVVWCCGPSRCTLQCTDPTVQQGCVLNFNQKHDRTGLSEA
jgi:hypothetical protein